MRKHQEGNALPMSLILLLVLTILGVSGLKMANSQLKMTGYEQFHAQAMHAAEAAIENALATKTHSDTMALTVDPVLSYGSNVTGQTTRRYITDGPAPGGGVSMANSTFSAYHFEIEGSGSAPANTQVNVTQGIFIVASGGN